METNASDRESLQEQATEAQDDIEKIKQQIAEAEANAMHRTCRYRNCGKEFATDDDRKHYCCPEHYLAENRERTTEKNLVRKTRETS